MSSPGRNLQWRQLLTNPPTSWTRLPVLVRGVGDEVLRHLDATAEIDCGNEAIADVVLRLIAAHPRERKMVRSCLRQLVEARFLVIETRPSGRFLCGSLPDISVGQPRREDPPPQTEDPPKEAVTDLHGGATESLTSPVTITQPIAMFPSNPAESHDRGPTEKRREEEKREEDREPRARDALGQSPFVDQDRLVWAAKQALIAGYKKRYFAATKEIWTGEDEDVNKRAIKTCARWAASKGEAEMQGRVDRLLDRVFAPDSRIASYQWPWKFIAEDPAKWIAAQTRQSRKTGFLEPGKSFADLNKPDFDIRKVGAP